MQGKTVQTIAFLAALLGKGGTQADAQPRSFADVYPEEANVTGRQPFSGYHFIKRNRQPSSAARWPILIVVPKSVVGNWERELSTWSYFKVGGSYTTFMFFLLKSAIFWAM